MGYYITIREISLKGKLPENLKRVNFWKQEGEEIVPEEYWMKLQLFEEDMKIMAKAGIEGKVITTGDAGEWTRYILKNGELKVYPGEVVYPDEMKLYDFYYDNGKCGFVLEINADKETVEKLLGEYRDLDPDGYNDRDFQKFLREKGYGVEYVVGYSSNSTVELDLDAEAIYF